MIDNKLVEQWAAEASGKTSEEIEDASPHFAKVWQAFAQLAAAHGAEQREKELLAVGMEPVAKVMFVDGLKTNNLLDCDIPTGTYIYTATQLAAARLQGAEEAKLWRDRHDHISTTCARLHRSVADLERVNQQLRDALDEISDHAPWGGTKDKHIAWMQNTARAAIAAAEKENTK